jgi:hypothetical protein
MLARNARSGFHTRWKPLQHPGSAKGVVFVTLEDAFGIANLVVLPPVLRRYRTPLWRRG